MKVQKAFGISGHPSLQNTETSPMAAWTYEYLNDQNLSPLLNVARPKPTQFCDPCQLTSYSWVLRLSMIFPIGSYHP